MAKPIEDNRMRKISTTNSVPNWTNEIYSVNPDVNTNELLIEHAKKVAIERKQFYLLPSKPLSEDFVKNNNIARPCPPFTPVMETRVDGDGRVVGHGFVPRITCLTPDKNKQINDWMDLCEQNKKLPLWHIPFEKLRKDEPVILDDFTNSSECSLLEDGRLIHEGDPIPYDVTPSPEFLIRQKTEFEAGEIQRQNERNRLDNEKIRKAQRKKQLLDQFGDKLVDEDEKLQLNPSPPLSPEEDPLQNGN